MDVQQNRQQRGGRYRVPNLQESRVASCESGQALLTVPIFAVYTAQDTMRLQAFWMDGGSPRTVARHSKRMARTVLEIIRHSSLLGHHRLVRKGTKRGHLRAPRKN